MKTVSINKKVLFDLLNSHSCLAENEYNKKNSIVTGNHFAIKAENEFAKYMRESNQWDIMNEFFDYSEQHVLDIVTGEEF